MREGLDFQILFRIFRINKKVKVMKNTHLIPTDKPSRLAGTEYVTNVQGIDKRVFKLKLWNKFIPNEDLKDVGYIPQNIYITSDEEIKVGDWYLTFTNKEVMGQPRKCEDANWNFSGCKKIILTTDSDLIKDGVQPINNEFLEWFVKNPSCEEVQVNDWMSTNGTVAFGGNRYQICNHLYDKKTIIPQEEPKQIKCYCGHTTYCDCGPLEVSDEAKQRAANYMSLKGALEPKQETTLEEAAQKYKDLKLPDDLYDGFIAGAEWQAERMYNEDDMRECWKKAYEESFNKWIKNKPTTIFKKWFEQFKKK